jgi:NAD(P)-dependent dehydrogenase (short-subunit alcohol dehydrogenase family)
MDTSLAGRVALITGASRGIGLAIAEKLGTLGVRLSLCARHEAPLNAAADQLRRAGVEVVTLPADVTREADVSTAVARTNTTLGEINILVNNAGIGLFRPVHEVSEAEWNTVLDTNLKGVFLASRAVVPQMIRRRSGDIVNIASLAGKNAFAGGGVYCASKWGLLGLTYCMAEDLRSHGIRVFSICPGSVATEFSPHSGKDPNRMLQACDVAHAVAMVLTAAPGSFLSEVLLRPTQKP